MDLPSTTASVVVAAPVAALLVYLIMLAAGRWLKQSAGVRLGLMYQLFGAAVGIYVAVLLFVPAFRFLRELTAGVVLTGTFFLIALVQRLVWESYFQDRRQILIPNLVRDVVALTIFLVVVMLVLSVGYDVRIPGLLAGSGIAAIVIGLALQDLLGNIFAGLVIQTGRPFKVGDWLLVDGRHVEVVEIHWRSTRLRTSDDVYLDVPHNQLARQTIVNFHYLRPRHALRVRVQLEYEAQPNSVKEVLVGAAAQAKGVLRDPPPEAFLNEFGDSGIEYEVRFWVAHHAGYNLTLDAVRTNIWYALSRAGLKIPFPIRTVHLQPADGAGDHRNAEALRAALRKQELLRGLDDRHIDVLIENATVQQFCRGERLVEQGAEGDSMLLLVRGQANVEVTRDGKTVSVGTLSAGECCGEMSLLTGEKRSARVVAAADCEVIEIRHDVFKNLIHAESELKNYLGDLMAKRRMQTEGTLLANKTESERDTIRQKYAAGFRARLSEWFKL
jgi:small-conductance mechanosensitive channel/CRP-like cAMP-binding protein